MGFAMIIVMLFHVPLSRNDMFYGLMRCGNNGVDMFLFLSGIGLWFAWTKKTHPLTPSRRDGELDSAQAGNINPSLREGHRVGSFYYRRFLRLYPAWLIIACLYYIPQFWPSGGGYSPNLFHLIANILVGWSFWRIDDLTFWCPFLYAAYPTEFCLAMAARCDDCVVLPGTRLAPSLESCGACGSFLEPYSCVSLRYKCRRVGEDPPPTPPRGRATESLPSGRFGGGYFHPLPLVLCLRGRSSPRSFSTSHRTDGLYPIGHQRDVPDVQVLRPCPLVDTPCFYLYGRHLP